MRGLHVEVKLLLCISLELRILQSQNILQVFKTFLTVLVKALNELFFLHDFRQVLAEGDPSSWILAQSTIALDYVL